MATSAQRRSAKEVVERLLRLIKDSDYKTYTAHVSQAALGLIKGPTMSAYLQDEFRPLKLLANYYMAIEEIVSITFGPHREQMKSLHMQPVYTSNSNVGRYWISLVTNICYTPHQAQPQAITQHSHSEWQSTIAIGKPSTKTYNILDEPSGLPRRGLPVTEQSEGWNNMSHRGRSPTTEPETCLTEDNHRTPGDRCGMCRR